MCIGTDGSWPCLPRAEPMDSYGSAGLDHYEHYTFAVLPFVRAPIMRDFKDSGVKLFVEELAAIYHFYLHGPTGRSNTAESKNELSAACT